MPRIPVSADCDQTDATPRVHEHNIVAKNAER